MKAISKRPFEPSCFLSKGLTGEMSKSFKSRAGTDKPCQCLFICLYKSFTDVLKWEEICCRV